MFEDVVIGLGILAFIATIYWGWDLRSQHRDIWSRRGAKRDYWGRDYEG